MSEKYTLASEPLKDEHEVILRMLRVLEVASSKVEKGDHVPTEVFTNVVDFIRTFADQCHHGKEQDTLFPLMGKRGIPTHGGPIAVMLMEHDEGRRLAKSMADSIDGYEAGDKARARTLIESARNYASLLQQHIYKEDNILYPMGDRVLTPQDNKELLEQFERIEERVIGEGKHEYYLNMVTGLERELGIVGGKPAHAQH